VDLILSDVTETLNDCRLEGESLRQALSGFRFISSCLILIHPAAPFNRSEFVRLFRKAEKSFELFRQLHERTQDEMLIDIEDLGESIRHQSAAVVAQTWKSATQQSLNSRFSLDGGSLLSPPKRASFATVVEVAEATVYLNDGRGDDVTPADGEPSQEQGGGGVNPLQHMDIWLAIQQFRNDVIAADSALLIFSAFAKSQLKRRSSIAVALADFLKSTLKIFANEQFRSCLSLSFGPRLLT
jgi:hypothetical protein